MKTITLVAHRRPQYLARVLESIAANDTQGYSLVAVLDGGPVDNSAECQALLENFKAMPKIIYRPTENLGVNYANRYVYRKALELGSVMNVAVEDDTPLAPDCLAMVNWWVARAGHEEREYLDRCARGGGGCSFFGDRWLMNCFSKSLDRRNQNLVTSSNCNAIFCPWVWAASRPVIENLIADRNWMCDENGWDWSINLALNNDPILKPHTTIVEPVVSRSSNIGRLNGAHYTPELFDEHFGKHVASDGLCRDYKFVE